jgi:UDP-glucose 4-epimerase
VGTLLVTGAAGFVGSHVARRLIGMGHAVLTIDNLSTGYIENVPPGCECIVGDLSDRDVVKQLSGRTFDAIFHIAGQSGNTISFDDPVQDLNSNVVSTLLLLDYARASGCTTFVYASSMSVYGDQDELPVREEAHPMPKSFYAVGKLASEQYMKLYSRYGIRCMVLRLNNVYGPGQDLSNLRQGMLSIYVSQAVAQRSVKVRGDKHRFRDFVHIDDVVEAFVLAGEAKSQPSYSIFNVATNRKTTVEEAISLIQRSLPYDVDVQYEAPTEGDQFGIYCAFDRIASTLGWRPTVSVEEGVSRMVRSAISKSHPRSAAL